MITAASAHPTPVLPDPTPQALLVVSLENFDIRYASQRAVEWLAQPAERLLGRSLLLSLPQIGQALSLAVQAGLSPVPVQLNVVMSNPDGVPLNIFTTRRDNDALIEFRVADDPTPTATGTPRPITPDAVGLQR